jgi:hypothetical protein
MDQLSFDFVESFEDTGIKLNKLGIFKTKICTLCKIEYEATSENFKKAMSNTNKDNLSSCCRRCDSFRAKARYVKRKRSGTCVYCSNDPVEGSQKCEYHNVYYTLLTQTKSGRFKYLKTNKQRKDLVLALISKLKDQNYKCAITGVEIALGINAQLDHIQEICNGGSCELSNLQWVSTVANLTKPKKYKENIQFDN